MKFIIEITPTKVKKILDFDKDHEFMQTAIKNQDGSWTVSPALQNFVNEESGAYVDEDIISNFDDIFDMENDCEQISQDLEELKRYSTFCD